VPDKQTEVVHELAIGGLQRLLRQHPLAAKLVQDTVGARMPHALQPRHMLCAYIRGTLLLAGVSSSLAHCRLHETSLNRTLVVRAWMQNTIRCVGIVKLRAQSSSIKLLYSVADIG
jgi:hypothetical protein